MMRFFLFSIVLVGTSAAGNLLTEDERRPGERLDAGDVLRTHHDFAKQLDQAFGDWSKKRINLRELARRIEDHCEVFYQDYLRGVNLAEFGSSQNQRVARNVIRLIETREDYPGRSELLPRIHAEFVSTFGVSCGD